MSSPQLINKCTCCGSDRLLQSRILWQSLIDQWHLSDREVDYIDRQQGLHCADCGANLRSMALAQAIGRCFGYYGLFRDFIRQPNAQRLCILEVNEAASLTPLLSHVRGHILALYPMVDLLQLPYADESFDLVVHSDTLEHVQDPIRAMAECYRVLKPGGFCAFTVPMVVDRPTISRASLPPSYHGSEDRRAADYLVRTEYGADAWTHVVQGGFAECRIYALEYPAAVALVGGKAANEQQAMPGPAMISNWRGPIPESSQMDNAAAPTAERVVPESAAHLSLVAEHVARYAHAAEYARGRDVIDIGCGNGYGAHLLLTAGARRVLGIDISPEAVESAQRHYHSPGLSFSIADSEQIACPDGSFDLAVCFEVVEHVADARRLLAEARRILKPNGILLLSTPNKNVYSPGVAPERVIMNPFHVQEFDADRFRRLIAEYFPTVNLLGQSRKPDATLRKGKVAESSVGGQTEHFLIGDLLVSITVSPGGKYAYCLVGIATEPVWPGDSLNLVAVCGLEAPQIGSPLGLQSVPVDQSAIYARNLEHIGAEKDRYIADLEDNLASLRKHAANLEDAVHHYRAWVTDLERHQSTLGGRIAELEANARRQP